MTILGVPKCAKVCQGVQLWRISLVFQVAESLSGVRIVTAFLGVVSGKLWGVCKNKKSGNKCRWNEGVDRETGMRKHQ